MALPVVYCDRSTKPSVVAECSAARLDLGRHYGLWIATLDGTQVEHKPGSGIVACQWKGTHLTGGDWDESLVYDPNLWLPAKDEPRTVTEREAQIG